jgi:hypothetical protein
MCQSRYVFIAALLLATLFNVSARAQTSNDISVTGTLTDDGVLCRAMRGDDGKLYTMRRNQALAEFKTGDRIKVAGLVAEMSICQQGITIVEKKIEKVR